MDLAAISNDIEKIVVTEEQIQNRLKELAAQVVKDYEGRDLILVGVLKGAIMAMADFSRHLQRHIDMDWMAVSSYGAGTKSSGVVRILKDLDTDILGREVLIVEDILDTGLTLSWLTENLNSRGGERGDLSGGEGADLCGGQGLQVIGGHAVELCGGQGSDLCGAHSTAEANGPKEILDLVVSLADRQFEQEFIDEQKA